MVSVHALTEVPLAFRAYYRVELPTAPVLLVPAQPAGAEPPAAHPAPEPVPDPEPAPAPAPAGLVLVEDPDAGDPVDALAPHPQADHEPCLVRSSPASLGFFA